MIKHVIFDVGEVLVNGFYGAEKHISKVTGRQYTNRELINPELWDYFDGKVTEDEFWQKMSERFGWKVEIAKLKEAIRENFTLVEGTYEIVVDLRRYNEIETLSILSIHGEEWVKHIQERHQLHHLFNCTHYSYEKKVRKPDQKAFELLLDEIGAKPRDCLFIDDYNVNIEAASKLGINTHLFKGAGALREELKLRILIE